MPNSHVSRSLWLVCTSIFHALSVQQQRPQSAILWSCQFNCSRPMPSFAIGSFLVRCAGCTWNDIVDQELDRKVSRTRLRPLAWGAVSTSSALLFTAAQVLWGMSLVVLLLSVRCLYWSIPSILLTGLYPYGKRFTHYPQTILGCVFSWGVIMAFPTLDLDLFSSPRNMSLAGCLFSSCIAWTMVYDTIYAAQNIKDDARVGIGSPVVRHQGHTRNLLMGTAFIQIVLLCWTGIAIEASLGYFVCTCFGTRGILGAMVRTVQLDDPKDCIWWFSKGSFFTGSVIGSGFIVEYVLRAFSWVLSMLWCSAYSLARPYRPGQTHWYIERPLRVFVNVLRTNAEKRQAVTQHLTFTTSFGH